MLLTHRGKTPQVHETAVIAPNSVLVGDVSVGPHSVIGCGTSIIAEGKSITLASQVIVRDNAVIRSTSKYPVAIGSFVLIGPHSTLFGCTIEDEVFLATGTTVFHLAVVRRRAEVRVNGVVHLRTVVAEGAIVPIGWVAVGDPASILPPNEHDKIWSIQKPLDFPGTVYGLTRAADGSVDMRELTRRLAAAAREHTSDEPA